MSRFKLFPSAIFILSLLIFPLPVSSSERADHHKLKSFLDCQLKSQEDCELKKPKNSETKKTSSERGEIEEKKQTQSQKFIFKPSQKRVKKGNASSR